MLNDVVLVTAGTVFQVNVKGTTAVEAVRVRSVEYQLTTQPLTETQDGTVDGVVNVHVGVYPQMDESVPVMV